MTATISISTPPQLLDLARNHNTPTPDLHAIYRQAAVGDDDSSTMVRRACLLHPHADAALLGLGASCPDDFTANLARQIIAYRKGDAA